MAYLQRNYPFTKSLTFYIIFLNIIVWLLQIAAYPLVDDAFSLNADSVSARSAYQLVTYMFLHATFVETNTGEFAIYPLHIAMNMLVFAIFGFPLERALGKRKMLVLYLFSGIGSALFYLFVMPLLTGVAGGSLIGASGAVFGVLAAYAFKYPKAWVYMLGFFPMPAAVLLFFLLVEETFLGFMGLQPGVANFGHVGGIITGLLIMTIWKLTNRENKFGEKDFEYVWE